MWENCWIIGGCDLVVDCSEVVSLDSVETLKLVNKLTHGYNHM